MAEYSDVSAVRLLIFDFRQHIIDDVEVKNYAIAQYPRRVSSTKSRLYVHFLMFSPTGRVAPFNCLSGNRRRLVAGPMLSRVLHIGIGSAGFRSVDAHL